MIFSVEIKDSGFSEAIADALGLSAKSFVHELKATGEDYTLLMKAQFAQERDPYGSPWTPLAPRTVKFKRASGSKSPTAILRDTWQLYESFKHEVLPDGLSFYTDRRFPDGDDASIHQFGGGRIPPRPMMPFDGLPPQWLVAIEGQLLQGAKRIFG